LTVFYGLVFWHQAANISHGTGFVKRS